jgi:hypothetical protein
MKRKFCFALLALTLCNAALFGQVGQASLSQYASKNDGATAFKSGDFIYAHVKLTKPLADLVAIEDGKPVTLSIEILENGKSIERDDFPLDAKKVKGNTTAEFVLPITSTRPCRANPSASITLPFTCRKPLRIFPPASTTWNAA